MEQTYFLFGDVVSLKSIFKNWKIYLKKKLRACFIIFDKLLIIPSGKLGC